MLSHEKVLNCLILNRFSTNSYLQYWCLCTRKKLDKDDRYNEKATTNLSETYHTSLNNIDIDAEVSDVTVKKGNEFAILSKGDDKKIKVNSKVNYHQWKISEYQTSTNINFRMQGNVYNHIVIIVPKNINNINIHTGSGSLKVLGITSKNAHFKMEDGDLSIKNGSVRLNKNK